MNVYVRYCAECGLAYDTGINFNLCSKCRLEKLEEEKKKEEDEEDGRL